MTRLTDEQLADLEDRAKELWNWEVDSRTLTIIAELRLLREIRIAAWWAINKPSDWNSKGYDKAVAAYDAAGRSTP